MIRQLIKNTLSHLDPEYIAWNISFGLHSNIPLCCTIWHTFVHAPHHKTLRDHIPFVFNVNDKSRRKIQQELKCKYVRCPSCFVTGKVNVLHECNDKCIPDKIVSFNDNNKKFVKSTEHIKDWLKIRAPL